MTERQLQKRVEHWLKALPELGLVHWRANVDIVDEPSSDAYISAKASVACSSHYDTFWMEFRREWVDDDPDDDDVDQVIIHELMHVVMRDFDHEVDKVEEFLGCVTKELWADSVKHAREGLVERLARTLYRTSRSDMVRSK
jgi:hypothetical protein